MPGSQAPEEFEPATQPFDWLSVHLDYEVLDRAAVKHRFKKMITARAKQETRFYQHTYQWSGAGRVEDPKVTSGIAEDGRQLHRLHGPRIVEGNEHIYVLYLGRELVPDEVETISLDQKLFDQENRFQPYLRYAVTSPAEEVHLRVTLPASFRVNVRAEVVRLATQSLVGPPTRLEPEADGSFVFTEPNPQVGVRYSINWL